ncbi:MAG: hypothetical protein JO009_08725 [Candidatus Eremiobacteraeota bacterium]|nr:hypothetical protein [Candidatus Eremiobacteraeota bacterium]
MNVLRLRSAGFFVVVFALVSVIACSGGGGGITPQPQPQQPLTQPGSMTESVPFSSAGSAFSLPTIAGYTETITLPSNNASAGTNLALTVSNAAPKAMPAFAADMHVARPYVYFTLVSPATVTMHGYPGFSVTFPAGSRPQSLPVKVGYFDPSIGWKHIGDMVWSGSTLTFTPTSSASITLQANAAYYAVTYDCGGPSPSPSPSASLLPSPSPSPSPTHKPSPSPSPSVKPSPSPSVKPSPSPSPSSSPACTGTIIHAATGGTISVVAGGATYAFTIPAGALTADSAVGIAYVSSSSLPAPLAAARHPMFTKGAGNTYISAWSIKFCSATMKPGTAISFAAASGATTEPKNTTLNVAINASSTWQDVGTALVGGSGTIHSNPSSAGFPGIDKSGIYLVYLPASGTSQIPSNLGLILAGDDTGNDPFAGPPTPSPNIHGVNLIKVEDTSGNALSTPVLSLLQMSNAPDIDGLTLTPDASQGAVVDGFNKVRFFSGVQTGSPVVSSTTIDVTAYGGDGDAIQDLPNGDEAVVSGDSSTELVVLSGILSGSPAAADTISLPGNRDSLVMSSDGTVLLGRGSSGLTVWKVVAGAAHTGSLGGTVKHTYTQTHNFTSAGYPSGSKAQDGRGGMAICPSDPSRGVVLNTPSTDDVSLLTGLPSSPTISSVAHIHMPLSSYHARLPAGVRNAARMSRESIVVSGGNAMGAVSITPDCKFAVIGTANISGTTLSGSGLIVVKGIDTGTLAQVGSNFNPTIKDMDGNSVPLGAIGTLAITLDGKYIGAFRANPAHAGFDFTLFLLFDRGEFFTIGIDGSGNLAIKGQLNNVAIPLNDQAVAH